MRAQHRVRVPGRELAKTLALVEKVSGTFSRRDPMRRYMDLIVAMAAASGELRERQWCEEAVALLLDCIGEHVQRNTAGSDPYRADPVGRG